MIEQLERMMRRALLLVPAVPLLLFGGWRLGAQAYRSVALPPDAPVRLDTLATAPVTLAALDRYMQWLERGGDRTEGIVAVYNGHIAPVERSLRRRGVSESLARRMAWPLVAHAARRELDPATVLAILLIESEGYPRATSPVGARGLMQVMPAHIGDWAACASDDLYDIDTNLCYGTSILASNLRRFRGDERRALLAYNGCIRGTNTPNCHIYPDRVRRIRNMLRAEWSGGRQAAAGVAAAP